MKRIISTLLMVFCIVNIVLLAGCTNTFKGAERDINNMTNSLNPPPHKEHTTTSSSTTSEELSKKLDATNQPIQKNNKNTSDAIPEESY